MNLLTAIVKPTSLKVRLLMIALLAIGIVLGGGGVAYAQSASEVMGTLDNAILVFAAALVFFMQAGFRVPRRRTDSCQEHGPTI